MPAESGARRRCAIGRDETPAGSGGRAARRLASLDSGQDHRELVAADAAGDVGVAHDLADALGDLGEHGVAGEVADAVVDRLEVVEVEDDQREPAVVALGARDLARERLVEVAAVVQAGQRVEVGVLARLAEAPRVLDRRARRARASSSSSAQVVVAERRRGCAREDAEPAEPAGCARRAARRAPRGSGRPAVVRLRVAVRDLDRARLAAVRRPVRSDLSPRLLAAEARARPIRRSSPSPSIELDEGRVDARDAPARRRACGEHLVEVDRAAELAEEPAPAALLLGARSSALQLARELVHPRLEHLATARADLRLGRRAEVRRRSRARAARRRRRTTQTPRAAG